MKQILHALNYLQNYPYYLYGLYRIFQLKKPIITIFGGKAAEKNQRYYQQAFSLSGDLVKHDFSVLTGGGPGIMEAALCGGVDQKQKKRMLGIGVKGLDVDFTSMCGSETIFLNNFALRKALLINYSIGFISFPGGIGTLDEIIEVLNLVKTKRISRIPIILIGLEYWKLIVDWFEYAMNKNFIPQECAKLLTVTDDLDHALSIMLKAKKNYQ